MPAASFWLQRRSHEAKGCRWNSCSRVEVVFLCSTGTRLVGVLDHAEQASRWICGYELSRKQTRRCSSRRICLAVSRSTTCIGP